MGWVCVGLPQQKQDDTVGLGPVGGLVFIKSQTVGTAVSSVQVTSAFSATYDSYKIIYQGGSASTANVLKFTLGAAATGYYYSFNYVVYGTTTASGDSGSNATSIVYGGQMSADGNYANIDVMAPYLAKRTYVVSNVSGGTGTYGGTCLGLLANTTSYTDFTLTCNSGTITGGTITVYGNRLA